MSDLILDVDITDNSTDTDIQLTAGQVDTQIYTPGAGSNDYNELINRPKINGIELVGDKTTEELDILPLTNAEIDEFMNSQESIMTTKYLDGTGLRYFRDTYVLTTAQVNALIQSAFAQYQQDVFTVVSALPQTGQQEGIMYLVPSSSDPTKLDGYIWEIVDDTTTPPTYGWKQPVVGQGQIDLSNYYTKTETDTLLAGKASSTHVHGNITNDGKLTTASRVVVTDASGNIDTASVTSTELGYLSGVTSNIQTQLNSKHDDTNHVALTNTEIDTLMA